MVLCSIRISFFFLSFFFFFFYRYFPWQTLTIQRIAGKREGINLFFCISLPPAHKHSFSSSRFLPLAFSQSICICIWDLFSLEICILFRFSLMQLSRSSWLWQFKVTLYGIWSHIKLTTFYYKENALTSWDWHPEPTEIDTTVYLSHLPNPTPGHHLSSIRLSKCIIRDFL